MADYQDYVNTPFAAFVNYIDSERQRQRQIDDADLDKRIALIHDLITAPGANPARTAEGIKGIMELQSAKGGRGKRKGGLSGFMGAQEEVMPTFLAQLIHNQAPFQGPTYQTEQRTVQEPGFERNALEPVNPASMPSFNFGQGAPTGGKSVLESPVMIPPSPIETPPTGTRMLDAARQMQHQEQIKTPLPMNQQPFMRNPDELAAEEGQAAGVKAGAIADAQKASVIKQMRELGATDEEIKTALLQQMTGRGSQYSLQDAEAGFYTVNGQVRRAVRVFSPLTGANQVLDALTRLPIPPDAQPVAAPSAQSETDPTSYKEYERYAADEKSRGNSKILSYDAWLTMDANRKRPTTTVNAVVPGTTMTYRDRPVFNQIVQAYQRSPLMQAKDRLVTLESNIRQLAANPSNAAAQLALGYSFVQALDTYQSAVREGELRNLTMIDSKIGNLQLWAQQMRTGMLMRPEIALQIAQAGAELSKAITTGSQAKEAQFRSQAQVNGLGPEWEQYIGGFRGQGQPTNPGANQPHQIGDTTTAKNGLKLYWDGKGWTDQPVVPPSPGGNPGLVQGGGIQR